ncbi:preprotein translocase subunit YajC [uncultured Pseudoteredinibacter sp.]|uniref:preprotein translocase subunit YajC n=1 Tax=uncultured Pseudoteredinibacter sp. TaxID=1641701 RepID=UPI0026180250|nr:preprotein translocase subunit YajC [uncultured Pseudoteredinibacter sp.]
MSFFIPSAMAQSEAAAAPGGDPIVTMLMFGGLFIFMYLFIIRPQRKRQKEHQQLTESVNKGDEVVMNSGLLGKVVQVDENYLVLDCGKGQELKFQKVALHAVLPKGTIKQI